MRTLLTDLRHTATPLLVPSREHMVALVKAANAALLREAVKVDPTPWDVQQLRRDLRRYALWLEDLAVETGLPIEETLSTLNVAANLYEFVGRLGISEGRPSIFEPPLNDLLRAAIIGSIGTSPAKATVIAQRIRDSLRAPPQTPATAILDHAVAMVVLALLGRQLTAAFVHGNRLRHLAADVVRELDERAAGRAEYHRVDRAVALGLACATAAAGMLVGASPLLDRALERLRTISERAKLAEDGELYWLANRLQRILEAMDRASVHRLLYEYGLPREYRRALAREHVYEFWGPQLDAIDKGLLDAKTERNFVVSIPTGAGKTMIAEMAIITSFKNDPNRWVAYVAPSRALVGQVSHDLGRRLKDVGISVQTVLAGAEQSALIGDEIKLVASGKTVTVTTPEKLDSYYRNFPDHFTSCGLVIFDEIHKLSDPTRGTLIESLVTRFLVREAQMQIILMSGVLSNHEDLSAWLGQIQTKSVVDRRRPTRQIRGVTVRHDEVPRDSVTRKGITSRRVDFSVGVALVHEDDDLAAISHGGQLDVQLPDLFTGYHTERWYSRGFSYYGKGDHTTSSDHAVSLARILARTPGSTLVFVQGTRQAETCCTRFGGKGFSEHKDQRDRLASFIAGELGQNHDLVHHCQRGLAYHHARLPTSVQRAIEMGLDKGWLKVVFATPTLREGLNTAATNVVLAGHTFFDEAADNRVPILETDFENLAGRAGRPLRETEGRIFLIPDSMAQAQAAANGKKYLLVGDEALRVRTQFAAIANLFQQGERDLMGLPVESQSILLGLATPGSDASSGVESFFERSLWSQQEANDEELRRVIDKCTEALSTAADKVGIERFQLAARTGLSLSSATTLLESLESHATDIATLDFSIGDAERFLPVLLEAVLKLPELRKGVLGHVLDWSVHQEPLEQWIGGKSYSEILVSAVASGALRDTSTIEDVVKYCSDVSTWLSWGFGGCYSILQYLLEDIHPWFGLLPLLVKYGVSSPPAAYLSLLGVADRTAANALSQRFLESERPITIDEVSRWLPTVGDKLEEIFPEGNLRGQLLRWQIFGERRDELPYLFGSLVSNEHLVPGQMLSFSEREGRLFASIVEGKEVGEVAEADMILQFAGNAPEETIGIVTSEPSDRRTAGRSVAIVVVRSLIDSTRNQTSAEPGTISEERNPESTQRPDTGRVDQGSDFQMSLWFDDTNGDY